MPTATELTINTAATAMDMANAIFGQGITVTAASFTGDPLSSGIYSGANATMPGVSPTDGGVILSTGKVTDFTNSSGTSDTNTATNTSTDTAGVDGDAQLNAVSGMATYDGAILQATFIPDGDYLTMQFVFTSEEYPEYVNGGVNDSFGVWVNGSFVPVTITVAGNVAIDEVNAGKNQNFYHDNTTDQYNTEMDGFTYTLSLKAPVNAGQPNTIKIGIADGGDAVWDSNLLIMGDSIQTVTLAFDDTVNVQANGSRNFDILANDSNISGVLTITQINGTAVVAGQTVTLATGQQVRLNADGTVTVFANGVIGEESLSYTVTDGTVTDIGYITVNTLAAGALDGIVSGTSGDDFIDAFYLGDLDGDRVDNNDATGVQGTTGNGDVIQAGAGNDYVLAGLGNDSVEAGTGNDTVDGGAGNDRAELGAGDDSYQTADPLAAGNDTVLGEAGNDAVLTGDGNDVIYGGAGNDSLNGGAGNDALYGGDDADRILAGAGDVVVGGEGGNDNDTLVASGVSTLIYSGGDNEAGTITFTDGRTVTFSQIEKLELNGNPDGIVYGTAGNDVIGAGYVDANGDVIDNNDSILTTPQGTNGDEVYAGEGDDTVAALLGDDFVYGGTGNDSIDGGSGNDYMQGDTGNDTVIAGDGNDFIRGDIGNDSVYGGAGDDSTYGGMGNDQVFGGDGNDQMFGGFGDDTVFGGAGNDAITGSGETDIVYGGDGDDSIQGSNGADTLYGGAGNDTMLGEEDADSFYGGAGDYVDGYESVTTGTDNDTLYVTGVASVVFDTLNPENGIVTFTAGGSLPFYNIENVYVDGVLIGNRNYIVDGTAGDDLINAGYVDGQGDRIDANDNQAGNNDDIVLAGAGNDTVLSGAGNDQVSAGTGDDSVMAGVGDDLVYGGDGTDVATGGMGNDTLYGGDGNDDLNGGGVNGSDGTDLIYGGAGNDTASGGLQADTIYGGAGDDLISGGADKDPDGRDLLDGGDGADTILGGYDGDTLIGGAGDDSQSGESGSDRFVLADDFGRDTVLGGEDAGDTDSDVLDGAGLTENTLVILSGDEAGTLSTDTDTASFVEIEQIVLGAGRDSVEGYASTGGFNVNTGAGDDFIGGGLGNDTIAAGAGADIVRGGAGNDQINLGAADGFADTLNLLDGDGNDIVAGFEGPVDNGNGTFTGRDQISVAAMTDAAGNPVNVLDVVVGNDGNGNAVLTFPNGESITLMGIAPAAVTAPAALIAMGIPAAGDGIVSGTGGGDLIDTAFTGDPDGDAIDANDALLSGAAGNDDLVQAGAGNDTVFAGDGADAVYGDIGDDLIDGGTGADSLYGGADADTFLFNAEGGNDIVVGGEAGTDADMLSMANLATPITVVLTGSEAGTATTTGSAVTFSEIEAFGLGSGADTFDGIAATTGLNVGGGDGNDTLRGGSGADTFAGGIGNDVIAGNAGNDSLTGGDGADTIAGGAGNDAIALGAADGDTDTVQMADGDGSDTVSQFEAPVNNPDGSLTGRDQLDVSDLTDATGQPVNTADVVVGNDGSGNAVLTFPNGESITLIGVAPAILNSPAALVAIGIPPAPDLVVDGTAGNDLMGPGYIDIHGDQIDGTDGITDTIYGYDGNDTIQAGLGNDLVFGGNDNDQISGDAGNDTLWGDVGNDALTGGTGDDTLDGGIGDDSLAGGADNDGLVGAAGNDSLSGDAGRDTLSGGIGADILAGGGDDDLLDGGAENDLLSGDDGRDTLFGDLGDDTLFGGLGNDQLEGGDGNDSIDAGAGDDTLIGGEGSDLLNGLDGRDSLDGSAGNDSLFAGEGDDTLTGGTGDDLVDGDDGNDQLAGGDGRDTLVGDAGNDTLDAGADNDIALGGDGDDQIFGAGGNDTITGGAGNDALAGGDDRDTFFGGAGDGVDGGEGGDDYDVLDLRAYRHSGINIVYDSANPENGTVQFLDAAGEVTGTLAFTNIEKIVACFTLGSMIQCERGEVAVEELQAGDRVLTRDHGLQPLRWVGRRDLTQAELAREPRFSPIRIEKGALGANLPQRDMMVSPQHRMLVAGPRAELLFGDAEVLVAATHMVGMQGVQRVYPRSISYVHILFDQHQIVRADGTWSESFQPGSQTMLGLEDAQREEVLALFPHLKEGEAYPSARLKLKASEARVLLRT